MVFEHTHQIGHPLCQRLHRHMSEAQANKHVVPITIYFEETNTWANYTGPDMDTPKSPNEPFPTIPNGFPHVEGRCPSCHLSSLFLGDGGGITCGNLHCENPLAAGEAISAAYQADISKTQARLWEDHDGAPFPAAIQDKINIVKRWWDAICEADFEQMAPKIGEYTSADLEIMGIVMDKWGISAPGEGMEAATLWYILGKVARAVAAYREGRQPSEDTLHDIVVYGMMSRRIREIGTWP